MAQTVVVAQSPQRVAATPRCSAVGTRWAATSRRRLATGTSHPWAFDVELPPDIRQRIERGMQTTALLCELLRLWRPSLSDATLVAGGTGVTRAGGDGVGRRLRGGVLSAGALL